MIRVILKTYSTCPDADPEFEFAYVELTIENVKRFITLLKKVKEINRYDSSIWKMEYWSNEATYCNEPEGGFNKLFGDVWTAIYDKSEFAVEPETFVSVQYVPLRVAGQTLCVTEDRLWWETHPKYGSTTISTTTIHMTNLRALARRLRGKHYGRR